MVNQKAAFKRAVEHVCGIYHSGRPCWLFQPPCCSTDKYLCAYSKYWTEALWNPDGAATAAEKIQLDTPWHLSDTSAVLCAFQDILAKGDRGKRLRLGGRVVAWALLVLRAELLAGCWCGVEGCLWAVSLGISALCPFPMECAGLRDKDYCWKQCHCGMGLCSSVPASAPWLWVCPFPPVTVPLFLGSC